MLQKLKAILQTIHDEFEMINNDIIWNSQMREWIFKTHNSFTTELNNKFTNFLLSMSRSMGGKKRCWWVVPLSENFSGIQDSCGSSCLEEQRRRHWLVEEKVKRWSREEYNINYKLIGQFFFCQIIERLWRLLTIVDFVLITTVKAAETLKLELQKLKL